MIDDGLHAAFLESFNEDLARLGNRARVAAVPGSVREMAVVDANGAVIGRVPTKVQPDVFVAFMQVLEENLAQRRPEPDHGDRSA